MARLAKLNPDLDAVLAMARLDPASRAVLRDCTETAMALRRLLQAGDPMNAVRLGGFALPRREAVWWAAMCAGHTAPVPQAATELAAREAAETWVRQQDDAARRRAMELAQQAGFGAAESWVAVAAFWSGDSMSPPGLPAVPPAPHLAGTAVCGAINLAAVRGDPRRRDARLDRFVASLCDIADGGGGRLEHEMSNPG